MTKPARCKKCGYSWNTKSEMDFVTCPRCRKLVDIKNASTLSQSATKRNSEVENNEKNNKSNGKRART